MSEKIDVGYSLVMRDAVDNVLITAVRQAIDIQKIRVEFDADLDPGELQDHTLTISVRGDPTLSVTVQRHRPLDANRNGFYRRPIRSSSPALLADLVKKAQDVGRFI